MESVKDIVIRSAKRKPGESIKAFFDIFKIWQRVLYPGLAVALFLYHRYDQPVFKGIGQQEVPSIFLSLLLGTLVYLTYRGIVHPVVWFFQSRSPIIGIPQQRFHKMICDTLSLKGTIRESLRFSQACLARFQDHLNPQERAATWSLNSGSHLLYMTATIAMLFLLHDTFFYHKATEAGKFVAPVSGDLLAWSLLFIVGIVAGVSYDRNTDHREAITLYQNQEVYKEIVRKASECWPDGTRKLTWLEVKGFVRWPGIVVILGIIVLIVFVLASMKGVL